MFGVFTMEMMAFPERPRFFRDFSHWAFVNGLADGTIDLIYYLKFHDNLNSIKEVASKCLAEFEEDRINSRELLDHCQTLQNL